MPPATPSTPLVQQDPNSQPLTTGHGGEGPEGLRARHGAELPAPRWDKPPGGAQELLVGGASSFAPKLSPQIGRFEVAADVFEPATDALERSAKERT